MYTEHVIEKVYWKIGEVSAELQEQPSALRYWIREFGLTVKRGRGTDRFFTKEDIESLKEIKRLLRVERYTIDGAVMKFQASNAKPFSHLLSAAAGAA